ncbi:MAG: phosphoribosylanthranilate isomerase [Deltaproteobacteria bacterium]|nr:phosphoribosylanthranilate isomerase [Deltaproteobacteria bacterium]MBW1984287.1 phosphoribosylanthranilate isomerase [Deltaproteobacteria bacterium]
MKKIDNEQDNRQSPQIKICGLTNAQDAYECASLGAHAIGCVFYPKSPRHVSENQARDIVRALPPAIMVVGVFVNSSFDKIMGKVDMCGLSAVQLHGQEPPDLVDKLRKEKLLIIKTLFDKTQPGFKDVSRYHASAYLVECGEGKLPGGNALSWEWGKASELGKSYPLILAGGISEDNICQAIHECSPDAVDISSGVESVPGRKDIAKVKSFISKVSTSNSHKKSKDYKLRRIFNV